MRWRKNNEGKRGGLRIIYYVLDRHGYIALLSVYAKNQKNDLTAQDVKQLKKAMRLNWAPHEEPFPKTNLHTGRQRYRYPNRKFQQENLKHQRNPESRAPPDSGKTEPSPQRLGLYVCE